MDSINPNVTNILFNDEEDDTIIRFVFPVSYYCAEPKDIEDRSEDVKLIEESKNYVITLLRYSTSHFIPKKTKPVDNWPIDLIIRVLELNQRELKDAEDFLEKYENKIKEFTSRMSQCTHGKYARDCNRCQWLFCNYVYYGRS